MISVNLVKDKSGMNSSSFDAIDKRDAVDVFANVMHIAQNAGLTTNAFNSTTMPFS